MARILCIEDSGEFQVYLSSVLKEHSLTHVGTIGEALRSVEGGGAGFDLIILDVSLPDGNGMKALPLLKEAFGSRTVPVVVVSADSDTLTKVAAFGIGADDFISKPPNSSELKARVEAKLRWMGANDNKNSQTSFENVFLDSEKLSVLWLNQNGSREVLDMTPIEFKILKLLMSRPGQVFSRDQIIERAWGLNKHVTLRTIDAHVSHLRAKLLQTRVAIETVLTAGYKLAKKDM